MKGRKEEGGWWRSFQSSFLPYLPGCDQDKGGRKGGREREREGRKQKEDKEEEERKKDRKI